MPTFGAFAESYIASVEAGWRNPVHRQRWRNSLRDYASALRDMPITDIATNDVLAVLQPIWLTKAETAALVVYDGNVAAVSGFGTVTMTSVERFAGSAFDDAMTGSSTDEVFDGGTGNGRYNGAGASDTYVFGRGYGVDEVGNETNDGTNSILLKEGLNWRDIAIQGAGALLQAENIDWVVSF